MRRLPAIIFSGAMLISMVTAASVSVAGPAAAAPSDSPSTGCSGQSCVASVYSQIQLTHTGNVSVGSGGGGGGGPLPVIHCWMQPWLDAKQMQNWWDNQSLSTLGSEGGQAYAPYAPAIDQHAKKPDPGMWWAGQNDGSMAGTTGSCNNLPLLEWVPPGQEAKAVAQFIQPQFLAEYAAARMTMPTPQLKVSPANKTFVKIPTAVAAPGLALNGSITASIFNGAVQATVRDQATGMQVSSRPQPPTIKAYPNGGKCNARGSLVVPGSVPACGLIFLEPSAGAVTITGSESWRVWWVQQPGFHLNQPLPTVGNHVLGAVDEVQSTN